MRVWSTMLQSTMTRSMRVTRKWWIIADGNAAVALGCAMVASERLSTLLQLRIRRGQCGGNMLAPNPRRKSLHVKKFMKMSTGPAMSRRGVSYVIWELSSVKESVVLASMLRMHVF